MMGKTLLVGWCADAWSAEVGGDDQEEGEEAEVEAAEGGDEADGDEDFLVGPEHGTDAELQQPPGGPAERQADEDEAGE